MEILMYFNKETGLYHIAEQRAVISFLTESRSRIVGKILKLGERGELRSDHAEAILRSHPENLSDNELRGLRRRIEDRLRKDKAAIVPAARLFRII